MDWHIGCSGFYYKHWRGTFYPQKLAMARWFDFYCRHFSTLELNVTFYRFPQVAFLQNWYAKSPPEFRFAVKAPRAITHYKKFNDTADLLNSFYDTINNGLKNKLGPVLFQIPPNYNYTEEKLEKIIKALNPVFSNVLEPRHPSWWQEDVYQKLAEHGIAFCGMSHPTLPDEVISNTPVVYYRFHGVPDLYRSCYTEVYLQNIADTLIANPKIKQAWLYFNNDVETHAIHNAKTMMLMAGLTMPLSD
ncbi:DUF72 domain-containing protein [Mucilaginibacter phyllosphaerae]|uniref:DUF72 domain-containing protein n=1 Tax=Mucilaginibacter phyllosphaerae TaxID=1812349 RepID=A0A4Y8A8Z9_9SPHI|nr:DUF72 domain-containing protein [Mucilaginibacter phyllosphaerae]MBB3970818.1 uncharacterized protein YecE (DUF72 family) [Mucilaginibacter phyllosphaerae]TEW64243.1 DUF72 domain-containing protein [Mucilaginibacter phyllosphaerae]GGH04808.1 hypothetical protein GCM10007352_08210 [Mucilaginibacter phyllosphaerae]